MDVRSLSFVVMVRFLFRFHPGLTAVKQWLHSQVIGRVVCADAHWEEYLPDWNPYDSLNACCAGPEVHFTAQEWQGWTERGITAW